MIGGDILKDDMVRPKVDKIKPALEAKLGALPYPNPTWKSDIANAALAVYAAERGRNGALYSEGDEDGMNAAIERVTGKIARINGTDTPLPAEMQPAQATFAVSKLDAEDLAPFGGAFGRGQQPLPAEDIQDAATFIPLDVLGERYAVVMPSGPVFNKDGDPLVVSMRGIAASVESRWGKVSLQQDTAQRSFLLDMFSVPGETQWQYEQTRRRRMEGDRTVQP
jgi:hypothetical protein